MAEEKPRQVYWAGSQWCVTDYGLETVEPDRYYVEARRFGDLTQHSGSEPFAELVRHIGEKTWVDVEDLFAAFAVGVQIHAGAFEPLPDGALKNAMEAVRAERWENAAFNRHAAPYRTGGGMDARDMKEPMIKAGEDLRRRRAEGPPFYLIEDTGKPRDAYVEEEDG